MKLTQSWVGYLDRSYQQIKSSVLARLVVNNPEITDHNESNILIIIVSMFAGVAEMLNYYIDMMGREAYIGTAQRFTSVIRLATMLNYRVRAKQTSTVNLLFYLTQADGTPFVATSNVTIPKGTVVSDVNGTPFRTFADATIIPNQSGAYSEAGQWTDVTGANIGVADGTLNQEILLDVDIVDESLVIFVDGVPWRIYDSLGLMKSTTQGFIMQVEEDGNAYLVFGDGVNGLVPTNGAVITGSYQTCLGASGNLPPNAINQLSGVFTLPAGSTLNATNPDYSSGGSDFEDIDAVRNNAPRWLRTLERAVTYQDYIDVAILAPGVGDAAVSYCCGKYVNVYIVPSSPGVATNALMSNTLQWFNCRKMVTTKVAILPAGISKMFLTANIFAKQLYTSDQVLVEVINLLYGKYGFPFSSINGSPSVSDMISLIESAGSVDHVDVAGLQVLPAVQPIQGNTIPLDITFDQLPKGGVQNTYTILYTFNSNQFRIFQGSTPVGLVGVNQEFNDGIVGFKITGANYTDGMKWQFITTASYPEIFPTTKLLIKDYSIPIFDIGPLVDAAVPRTIYSSLTVVTQGVSSNCMAPCGQ